MAGNPLPTIPVMRPLLPETDRLLPYLRRIDQNRWYSNFGPLAVELETRLSAHWGGAAVLTLANATLGLSVALRAAGAAEGTLCLMPAWTFIASAHAAVGAGMVPYLADVDEHTGRLTPALAEEAVARAPAPVGAVMPVCPFGAPVDWAGWEDFHRRTGLPVVIDAAAAFDALRPGPLPAVVSLHATKALGAGEGGVLVSADAKLVERARRLSNFGFLGDRVGRVVATNAKMSEYQAAVALASLDDWPATRERWKAALGLVRQAVGALPSARWPTGLGNAYVASAVAIGVPDAHAVARCLADAGIETRQWWQGGIQTHPAFADTPAMPLPVTARLARGSLGLPCWLDMNAEAAGRIAKALSLCAPPCPQVAIERLAHPH